MKTKTLLVVTPYFPPAGGGLERYAYEISTRLSKDYKWKVVFASSGEFKGKDSKRIENGITIYRLGYNVKFSNTPFSFSWFGKAKQIIKDEKPDIINIQSPVPGIGNIFAGFAGQIPVVVTYHAGSMKKGKFITDLPLGLYEKTFLPILLNSAKEIITASDFVKNVFLRDYMNKSTTITPGTNTNDFEPSVKMKNKRPTILFVASLTRADQYKGLQNLIEITNDIKKRLPDILVSVVGGGDMKEEYQKRVIKMGLEDNFVFHGRLSGNNLIKKYQEAHIFVSLSSNESFGMSILEATSCGIPVVAFDVGGVSSLVKNDQNGFLVNLGNISSFKDKVIELLIDKKLNAKLGNGGRNIALTYFDWRVKANETNMLLERVLNNSKKKNIVQLVAYYPPHTGGMEIVAEEVSKELAKKNYCVRVITSNIGVNKANSENTPNLVVERLNSIEQAHTPIMWSLPLKLFFLPKKSIFHVHISQIGLPEVALIVAKIRGFKYVAHFHLDVGPSGKFGFLFLLYKKYILGIVLRNSDSVIVFSEMQKKLVHDKYYVLNNHISIIPNGVAEDFFYTKVRSLPKRKLNLLYVGRLATQKKVERLVEAMPLLKSPAQLTIVGDGEDMEKLIKISIKLKLKNITFTGRKNGTELREYYKNADAFVISSDREGMPLVVLEAMAAGLPIVASNVIGLNELVDGTGILVNNPSPKTFAESIDKLWQNPLQLRKLSDKSLKKAGEYSWSHVVTKIERIYEDTKD
jgi:glycosyltransferase involved in cell wall biosynthesis